MCIWASRIRRIKCKRRARAISDCWPNATHILRPNTLNGLRKYTWSTDLSRKNVNCLRYPVNWRDLWGQNKFLGLLNAAMTSAIVVQRRNPHNFTTLNSLRRVELGVAYECSSTAGGAIKISGLWRRSSLLAMRDQMKSGVFVWF